MHLWVINRKLNYHLEVYLPRTRDSQKSKLYKAEKVLEEISMRLETIPEIEVYLIKVLRSAPIQRRYGDYLQGSIKIRDGRGARIARGCNDWIKLPKWARTEYVVLHEIAHTITARRHSALVAAHGREYAAIYLDLVWFGMGVEAHDKLKASFKATRVKFRPKRGAPEIPLRPAMRAQPLKVVAALPIAAKRRP
jgi:putative metallohydrolase (TIGR04338 family)